eukprot:c17731_g1_i1.p1 GENE.c17731_g1_i1~~c17731_g1_i1.p1  ORF type:complete len:249 (-),score=44.04 c17731_g1_i1:176-922(-)
MGGSKHTMAESQERMPHPPPLYRLYLNYINDGETDTFDDIGALDTPILPPPPIPSDPIHVFGVNKEFSKPPTRTTVPELGGNFRQLYDPNNPDQAAELAQLNLKLQEEFKQLVKRLLDTNNAENPGMEQMTCTPIEEILINMHHLLAEFRPHQALLTISDMIRVATEHAILLYNQHQQVMQKCTELVQDAHRTLALASVATSNPNSNFANSNSNLADSVNKSNSVLEGTDTKLGDEQWWALFEECTKQ